MATYRSPVWSGAFALLLIGGCVKCMKIAGPSTAQTGAPKIDIEDWLQAGDIDWQATTDGLVLDPDLLAIDVDKYIISEYVTGLVVSCQANYPIEWHSDVGEVMTLGRLMMIQGKVVRESLNVFDSTTFKYTSYIMFRGHLKQMTGRYTCQKVGDSLRSSSVFMFWGGPPPTLVLASRALQIQAPRHAPSLLFPCFTSTPNATVNLYKSVLDIFFNENYYKVKSDFVTFDPTKGITLDLRSWTDVPGDYKCGANDSSDFVDITVTQGLIDDPDHHAHVDMISRNASFTYNIKSNSLVCCSSSGTPPLLNSVVCPSPTMCGLLGDGLFDYNKKVLYAGYRIRHMNANGSCVSMQLTPGIMGHFQCVGDSINVVRTLYTSYPDRNGTYNIFTSWDQIKPEEMIQMSVQENYVDVPWGRRGRRGRNGRRSRPPFGRRYRYRPFRPHGGNNINQIPRTIYSGESITFRCLAPTSYFAHGAKFVIRWNNQTLQQIPSTDGFSVTSTATNKAFVASWRKYGHFASVATATAQIHSNMSAIICYAPVYNSTAWVQREIPLHAKEPTPPSFASGDGVENIYWILNETNRELRCEGIGEPMPNVTLLLNNKPVRNSSHVTVIQQNATVIMKVPQVFHDFHGQYSCLAFNLGGTVEKQIVVFVEEAKHTGWVVALVSCLSVGVLGALVFAGWRYWQGRRIMS